MEVNVKYERFKKSNSLLCDYIDVIFMALKNPVKINFKILNGNLPPPSILKAQE